MAATAHRQPDWDQSICNHPDYDQHEHVIFREDPRIGLKAIIAVHNTALGPALGGLRMWPYASIAEATTDALKLSQGMTYKSALANLPLGGGKAVIIGDPQQDKSDDLLLAMADFVNSFAGQYVSAEDSGTCVGDMKVMATRTPWVAGIADGAKHGGDPSPSTAYGTYVGILAAVKQRLGVDDLQGIRVAIQGVGNVGLHLAKHLADAGATLLVSDIQQRNLARLAEQVEATVVHPDEIHRLDVEVYSPCAMGGAINSDTVTSLRAPVVAGAANNQLQTSAHGQELHRRGILYAPDFAINAGGIIDIAYRSRNASESELQNHIESIQSTLKHIFERAYGEGLPTDTVARSIAEDRFLR